MFRKADHGLAFRGAALAASLALCLSSSRAFATNATTTFNVTATVVASCTVPTATNMPFGIYTGLVSKMTSTITITCTNGTGFTIGLNKGTGTGGTTAVRVMTGPAGATLTYSLYQDSLYGTSWGNAAAGWVSSTGTGSLQSFTVYGRMTAGQPSTVGSYTDSVTATITY